MWGSDFIQCGPDCAPRNVFPWEIQKLWQKASIHASKSSRQEILRSFMESSLAEAEPRLVAGVLFGLWASCCLISVPTSLLHSYLNEMAISKRQWGEPALCTRQITAALRRLPAALPLRGCFPIISILHLVQVGKRWKQNVNSTLIDFGIRGAAGNWLLLCAHRRAKFSWHRNLGASLTESNTG